MARFPLPHLRFHPRMAHQLEPEIMLILCRRQCRVLVSLLLVPSPRGQCWSSGTTCQSHTAHFLGAHQNKRPEVRMQALPRIPTDALGGEHRDEVPHG